MHNNYSDTYNNSHDTCRLLFYHTPVLWVNTRITICNLYIAGEQGNGNALPQWAIILIAVMCALLVVIVLVVGVVFAVIALSRTTYVAILAHWAG